MSIEETQGPIPVDRQVRLEWYCQKCHRVFIAAAPKCCGTVVEFDLSIHGRALISGSNAWATVWSKWQDHPIVRQVADEWASDGNCSAAGILNDAFKRIASQEA